MELPKQKESKIRLLRIAGAPWGFARGLASLRPRASVRQARRCPDGEFCAATAEGQVHVNWEGLPLSFQLAKGTQGGCLVVTLTLL